MLPLVLAIVLSSNELSLHSATAQVTEIAKESDIEQRDAREIAELVAEQFAAWNRRDIDAYMKLFWMSPLLIFAVEGEVWIGWDQVKANLLQEYSDRERMGISSLERLETYIVSPETATTIERWSRMSGSRKVSGFTTSAWHKFASVWRIITGHSSVLETQ